jgi:hypothetical protein
MIEGKSALLALWVVVLIACCAVPFGLLISGASKALPTRLAPSPLSVTVLFGAATLLMLRALLSPPAATSPLVLSLAFVAPLLSERPGGLIALGGLAALPFIAPVTWWEPDMALGLPHSVAFLIVGVLAAAVPGLPFRTAGIPAAPVLATLLVFAVIAARLMGQFDSPLLFWFIWHHWGAYVAPAQAMLGGGVPFHEFPVQYGMGPTLLISALGRKDLWFGLYLATALSNAFYLLVLAGSVGLVLSKSPRGLALLAVLAIACAVLLWTGYPPEEAGPMMGPSVAGMRFLPLALLILAILVGEAVERPVTALGYVVWLCSLAWSPEAGVYATIVWFPYLALRAAQRGGANTPRAVAWAALRGVAIAVASLAAGVVILTLMFRVGFGDWPSASGFLTYVRNPPGMLPPNPLGPIWLMLATLATGAVALTRADARGLRTGTACLLGLVAASSYYLLGRSHDNNVLNLFPFLVLLISVALSLPLPSILEGFSRMVLVGILAWPATFGFQSSIVGTERDATIATGPGRLLDRFRLVTPDAWALLDAYLGGQAGRHAASADAGAALVWLADRGAGPPLVINQAFISPRYAGGPEWTGVNNLANFELLPREVIVRFIQNGAASYNRQGWLLVDREQPGDWQELFGSAYEVAEERAFGGYSAYRLIPK